MSQKSPALWDYMDVAEEDLAKSGVAAMSFLFYFLAYSIKLLQEYPQKITLNVSSSLGICRKFVRSTP